MKFIDSKKRLILIIILAVFIGGLAYFATMFLIIHMQIIRL
jgi:hypothetical protein